MATRANSPTLGGLSLQPPLSPMLARPGPDSVPTTATAAFEPKWDGFRVIVFRDGDDVVVQGRSGDDLSYAFPEVVAAARAELPDRIVIDGELVILTDGACDFPAMGARIRPRSEAGGPSITGLSEQTPATFIAFDLLCLDAGDLLAEPYAKRRERLVSLGLGQNSNPEPTFRVTPMTRDHATAQRWFTEFEGGGLDGLIVKELDAPYSPGKRTLLKIKHQRTLDAVVAGWRAHTRDPFEVGSLLLGLFRDDVLHHIGVASGFSAKLRAELTERLAPMTLPDAADHPWRGNHDGRRPGAVNRWSKGRDQAWHALAPEHVAEVAYDQFEGDRLRHVARWVRWRPDRGSRSCTWEQVPVVADVDIAGFLTDSGPKP